MGEKKEKKRERAVMMLSCTWEVGRPWLCSETTVASMPPHSLLLIQYFVLFSQRSICSLLCSHETYVRTLDYPPNPIN